MQDVLGEFLQKRKNRAIAIILNAKERDVDPVLPAETREKFRKIILDQINEFHESCIDVMGSLDTGQVVLNDLYIEKIDQIHEAVTNGRSSE